jgi:hypothetical protein
MAEFHSIALENTANLSTTTIVDDNSTIRRVLVGVEHLIDMLNDELVPNRYSLLTNSMNYSPQQRTRWTRSLHCSSTSSTITSVTLVDDNHRLIEHLRTRLARLEHERTILLTSYQLLIQLLR